MAIDWRGVFPALTTKFTAEDELDFEAMERHLEFMLDAGVHGLVVMGSLGENSTLSPEEKRALMDFFVRHAGGRAPVIAGIAESATRDALGLVRHGERAGVDGFMVLPPMRYPSDTEETLGYFNEVAAGTVLPIMLYNNPIAYGTDLLPEHFARLVDNPSFRAIKESSADTRRLADIRRVAGDRFALFCGVDDLALESFAMGAVGWVAGLVVAFPAETVRLYDLAMAGQWREARRLYEWFLPLLHLDVGPKFVQQIKLVEEFTGTGSARVRPPRQPLNPEEANRVRAVVDRALATRPEP